MSEIGEVPGSEGPPKDGTFSASKDVRAKGDRPLNSFPPTKRIISITDRKGQNLPDDPTDAQWKKNLIAKGTPSQDRPPLTPKGNREPIEPADK